MHALAITATTTASLQEMCVLTLAYSAIMSAANTAQSLLQVKYKHSIYFSPTESENTSFMGGS